MQTIDQGQSMVVYLSKPLNTRVKKLFLVYALVLFFSGLFGVFTIFTDSYDIGGKLMFAVLIALFLIASYRFFNSALRTEKLVIDRVTMTYTNSSIFLKRTTQFEIRKIKNLLFKPRDKKSNHVLSGKSLDYLGYETEEKVMDEMHGQYCILFDYDGQIHKIGNNVYSWEFDEIKALLDKYKES